MMTRIARWSTSLALLACSFAGAGDAEVELKDILNSVTANANKLDGWSVAYSHTQQAGKQYAEYFNFLAVRFQDSRSKEDISALRKLGEADLLRSSVETYSRVGSKFVWNLSYKRETEAQDVLYASDGTIHLTFDKLAKNGLIEAKDQQPVGLRSIEYLLSNIALVPSADAPVYLAIVDDLKNARQKGGLRIQSLSPEEVVFRYWRPSLDYRGKYCVSIVTFDPAKMGAIGGYSYFLADSPDSAEADMLPYVKVAFGDFQQLGSGFFLPKSIRIEEFVMTEAKNDVTPDKVSRGPIKESIKSFSFISHAVDVSKVSAFQESEADFLSSLPPGSVIDDKISGFMFTSKQTVDQLSNDVQKQMH